MFNIPGISKEELEKARKAATKDMIKENDRNKSKDKKSRRNSGKNNSNNTD